MTKALNDRSRCLQVVAVSQRHLLPVVTVRKRVRVWRDRVNSPRKIDDANHFSTISYIPPAVCTGLNVARRVVRRYRYGQNIFHRELSQNVSVNATVKFLPDACSCNGLTYVTSARVDVGGSLEIKRLRIKLASLSARVTV